MSQSRKTDYIEIGTNFGVLSSWIDLTQEGSKQVPKERAQTMVELNGQNIAIRPGARAALRKLIQAASDHKKDNTQKNEVGCNPTEWHDIKRGIQDLNPGFASSDLLKVTGQGSQYYIDYEASKVSPEEKMKQEVVKNIPAGVLRLFQENGKEIISLNDKPLELNDFSRAALGHMMRHGKINDREQAEIRTAHSDDAGRGEHILRSVLVEKFINAGVDRQKAQDSVVYRDRAMRLVEAPKTLARKMGDIPAALNGWI